MNKNLLIEMKEKSYRIFKSLNANLIQNCNYFENFKGRDIDAFYEKKIKFKKVSKNIIIRAKNKNDLRFHINYQKSDNFLTLDAQCLSTTQNTFRKIFACSSRNRWRVSRCSCNLKGFMRILGC